MGYKQSLLQRLQSFEMSTQTKSASETKSKTETDLQPLHITDFSIQRILSDPPEKCKTNQTLRTSSSSIAQDTPPTSPTLYAPVAHKPLNTADILDLSKSKVNESYATSNLNDTAEFTYTTAPAFQYPAIHPNILAAVAAANAQKFYAQFLPHMFQGIVYPQHPLMRTMPTAYQKRYFAPYVLNNNATSTVTSNTLPTISQVVQPPLTPPTPTGSQTLASITPNKVLCSRLDCVDCLDPYYKNSSHAMQAQYPYKSPILSPTASTVSSTSSTYHSKAQKDVLQGSSNISLTSVTNIHFPSSTKTSKTLYSSSSLFESRSSQSANLEEISYKCRICDKVFGCSQTLQAHEKTHKSPRYECTDCGKGFSQLRNYKYHLSVHRGTKEFAAECPECGKTFNDKGYLSSHMKIHRNKKEYECPYCPKSFNQRVAFNMHVRIHTGVKPHKCAECGKRFSRKMLLKQHMRTHSGEKPYQCSVCGKSFADRSNMTLHHRLHSGIKPFNCPICPKAFTKKHHLKTHLNYHTGCKPYVCPHPNCNQAFTQSSNMRTHAKKCQYRPLTITASYPERISTKDTKLSTATVAVSSNSSASAKPNLLMSSISRLAATTVGTSTTAGNLYHNMSSGVNVTQSNIPASFMASTTLSAGIRMLSTVTSTVPLASAASASYPPAQQPLLSTLRPF